MSRGAGTKKSASPRQQSTKEFIKSALGSTEREPGWEYGQVLPVRARKNEEGKMEREWGLGYSNTAKGMLDAVTLPRRALEGEEVSPEQAMEMAMNITAPGVATARYAPGVLNMPIVYHGTPHRFDPTPDNPLGEFDAFKIGTGEGAQMYGHGIYLAEAPDVAKQYAQMDSPFAAAGPKGPAATIVALAKIDGGDNPVKFLRDNYDSQVKKWGRADVDAAIASLERGNLYTADLPDEMVDRMLDWDKPLSEQHPDVVNILEQRSMGKIKPGARLQIDGSAYSPIGEPTGADIYNYLNIAYKDSKKASETLKQLGIPGIKYLDRGSRGEGKGTRNFVLFPGDEKKAKILKRD